MATRKMGFVTVPSARARKKSFGKVGRPSKTSFKSTVQEYSEPIDISPFETPEIKTGDQQEPYKSWVKKKTLVYEGPKYALGVPKKHYMNKQEYSRYLEEEIEKTNRNKEAYEKDGVLPGWSKRTWHDGWIKPQRHVSKEIVYLQKSLDKYYANPKREEGDKIEITLSKTPFFKDMVRKELKENHGVNNLPEKITLSEDDAKKLLDLDKSIKKNAENLKKVQMNFADSKRHGVYKRVHADGSVEYMQAQRAYEFDLSKSKAKREDDLRELEEFEKQQERVAKEVAEVTGPIKGALDAAKKLAADTAMMVAVGVGGGGLGEAAKIAGVSKPKALKTFEALNNLKKEGVPEENRMRIANSLVKNDISASKYNSAYDKLDDDKLDEYFGNDNNAKAEAAYALAFDRKNNPTKAKETEERYANVSEQVEPLKVILGSSIGDSEEREKTALSLAFDKVTQEDMIKVEKEIYPDAKTWTPEMSEAAKQFAFLRTAKPSATYGEGNSKKDYSEVRASLEKQKIMSEKEIAKKKDATEAINNLVSRVKHGADSSYELVVQLRANYLSGDKTKTEKIAILDKMRGQLNYLTPDFKKSTEGFIEKEESKLSIRNKKLDL